MLRISRQGPVHELHDVTVRVVLEGSKLETSYYEGDNSWVVPTDTIKNTVFVMAKKHPFKDIEVFGVTLARHFLTEYAHFDKAVITLSERPWNRMTIDGAAAHPFCDEFSLSNSFHFYFIFIFIST